jgi:hypothetical protein
MGLETEVQNLLATTNYLFILYLQSGTFLRIWCIRGFWNRRDVRR